MKRVALVLAVLIGGLALAQSFTAHRVSQRSTEMPPTDAGQGLSLSNLQGWRLSVCAPARSTNPDAGKDLVPSTFLSGDGGTMEAWLFDVDQASWQRNPDLDETVTSTNVSCAAWDGGRAGCRCQVWADRPVSVPQGRVFYVAKGVRTEVWDGGGGALADDGGYNLSVQLKGVTRSR